MCIKERKKEKQIRGSSFVRGPNGFLKQAERETWLGEGVNESEEDGWMDGDVCFHGLICY